MQSIRESWRLEPLKKFYQEYKLPINLFLIWRVYLFILGFISFSILPIFKASFPFIDEYLISSGFPQWFWQWGNFDGVHYLDIAKNGYHASGLQVFFPFYPLTIKLVSVFIPNYFLSAFIISNMSFFLALLLFYKVITKYFDRKTAQWAVIFMTFFPTSFFFGAIYTEALFLLLLLLTLSTPGIISGLLAGLAGCTRLVGLFFVPAAIFKKPWNYFGAFGLLGIVTYMTYLWVQFSNPFYFLSGQGAFRNQRATSLSTLVSPPQVLVRYLKIFLTADPGHYDYAVALWEFSFFVFAVIALLLLTVKKKIPASWLFYGWCSLLLPAFSGTLSSMPRYVLTIFPIYIGLALIKSPYLKIGLLLMSAILLSIFTILFARGYWVG